MKITKDTKLNFTLFQLKSYFRNLPFIFLFMGIFYFCFIVIVYSFVGNTVKSLTSYISNSISVLENVYHQSEDAFKDFIDTEIQSISQMKSNDIHILFDGTYLNDVILRFKDMLTQNYGPAAQEIITDGETVVTGIVSQFIFAVCYLFLSVFFSDFAMKFSLRYYSRKNSIAKVFISVFFEALLGSSFLLLLGYLSNLNKIYFYLVFAFILLLFSLLSLLFGYFLQGRKQLSIKQVVNLRNIVQNYVTTILVILLPLMIFYLIFSFARPIFAYLLLIPLILYSFDSIGFANENYILGLKEKVNTK